MFGPPNDSDVIQPRGWFHVEKRDVDGTLLWEEDFPNGVTTEGLNDILEVHFRSGSQHTAWYAGLVDNAGFSAYSAADTMASHSGWTESSAYGESVRQTYSPGAASGGVISNSSAMVFTANTTVTIKGAFITTVSTKGGTTGKLWATGSFSVAQALTNLQTLSLTYSLTVA